MDTNVYAAGPMGTGTVSGTAGGSTVSGVSLFRGYPTSTWTWDAVSLADFTALRDYLTGGDLSAACYVQTRDLDDVWSVWRAVVDVADTPELRRWSAQYLGLTLTFTLIEAQ